MKKWMLCLMLFSAIGLFSGCSNDEADVMEETEAEAALFQLTLTNNTGEEVEVFLKDSEPSSGFDSIGNLPAGGEMVLEDLSVRQTYVVRAAYSGGTAEDHFYEQTILQESPTDLNLAIEE